jgi:hypothetical protein
VGDQSLRSLPVFERLQGEQRLRELLPKRRFIALSRSTISLSRFASRKKLSAMSRDALVGRDPSG